MIFGLHLTFTSISFRVHCTFKQHRLHLLHKYHQFDRLFVISKHRKNHTYRTRSDIIRYDQLPWLPLPLYVGTDRRRTAKHGHPLVRFVRFAAERSAPLTFFKASAKLRLTFIACPTVHLNVLIQTSDPLRFLLPSSSSLPHTFRFFFFVRTYRISRHSSLVARAQFIDRFRLLHFTFISLCITIASVRPPSSNTHAQSVTQFEHLVSSRTTNLPVSLSALGYTHIPLHTIFD